MGSIILVANQDNNLFITSFGYFYSFLDHPGGIIEYIGIFLSQFLRFRLIGALIISGIVTLSYFAVCHMSMRLSDNKHVFVIGILTPILLIGLHNNYSHQIYHTLGFIIVMFITLLIPENKVKKEIFLLSIIPVIYYVCGGYLWIFCAVVLIEHFTVNRKTDFKLIALLIGYPAILTVAARLLFLYPTKDLLFLPFPYKQQYGIILLQYIFVLWVIFLPLLLKVSNRWKFLNARWGFLSVSILCFVGFSLVINFTYNKKNNDLFRIEKYALKEDWNGLLKYANRHPSMNLFGSFYTNIALANKGLLCSGLFDYPQPFGRRGLCFEWAARDIILKRGSDFFWTINFVNEAHHWAFESMIVNGFSQHNLKRLIQTELVRGNYKVAEKYIHLLDNTLFDKRIADYYRRLLNNPGAIKKNTELGPRKKVNINLDFFADGSDLEKNLRSLLSNDPSNLPAFDYLMSLFLLEKRVVEIGKFLPYYLKCNDGKIPVLLDEGLLVYKTMYGNDKLPDIRVSQNTILRYNNYVNISKQYTNQNDAANALYPSYKNSFWFYLNFGSVPKQ